ncbi:hypothetical protein [Nostoc sp. 'Peltigera membranacea cyanobiont' 232]|uniref:hypothetical protein n=1 Tax=Nostoc sp. 'Peltigera membranacea cyanobiont' 232 TaxID=2014531 RepID=UPI000B952081|nr:hypothetical protein [Nostoc sp. 'Peltigera membranacea cyanobiont' 232]OYE02944.1 hypothetical protein CDG79_20980 [Nostoc sp. 'Peltigera membranacea cyanobiont' 232]
MADTPGLYATLAVTGTQLALDGTEKPFTFYFRGAKKLYEDPDWKTATGITDVSETHRGQVVLTDIGDLILHEIVRTAEVELKDSDNGKVVAIKRVRYAASKSSTVEEKKADGGIVGLGWKGTGKFNGKPVGAVIETRKMIVD